MINITFSKNYKFISPCICLLCLLTGQVNADEEVLSGRELLADCGEGVEPNQYCMHYVFGLVQTVDMLQQADPGQKLFCIDPNVISLQEVTLKVTQWLRDKADRLNEDAYVLVSEALNTFYPCKPQGI